MREPNHEVSIQSTPTPRSIYKGTVKLSLEVFCRKVHTVVMAAVLIVSIDGGAPNTGAAPIVVDLSALSSPNFDSIPMGTAINPSGIKLTIDGTSLRLDGKPWLATMGEFHYTRYPQDQWRDELLKMKAGGIDIVATYVFWIHHEEVEGKFDWQGRRDLREFLKLASELGLHVLVRIGPWDHGEVRNGGFPDWLLAKGYKLRGDDPGYLKEVSALYTQVAQQLHGLLWKDGGPVIGIQVENEYPGPAAHLLTLKKMAVDAGLDVPIYTRTGWTRMKTPVPFGQLIPLFSGYAEGFWDRQLTTMPGSYWKEFVFKAVRDDSAVASDKFGIREAKDEANTQRYPYLTCELGGGMMTSYHRRMLVFPQDIISLPIVRIGSGSNQPGYYMYQGGENPDSETGISLNEGQSTTYTNYNDLPQKTYDFQAPLGEFGQVRPQYHLLRRLHLFLHDFGEKLATMPAVIAPVAPAGKNDSDTLRWSVRCDGSAGYIFVNNYQRLMPMHAKPDVQWQLKLADGKQATVPSEPLAVPEDSSFFLPFNLDLGNGIVLIDATAQPVCTLDDGSVHYTVFAQIKGVATNFTFGGKDLTVETSNGIATSVDGRTIVKSIVPGTTSAISIKTSDNKEQQIIVLDDETSLQCYKATISGKPRLILTKSALMVDGDKVRLQSENASDLSVEVFPKLSQTGGGLYSSSDDGLFQRLQFKTSPTLSMTADVKQVQPPGPPRQVSMGIAHVAAAPTDADFAQAGAWHIGLPSTLDPARDYILRFHYSGDVARAYIGDKLLTDNFFNGSPFDVGLKRFGPDIYSKGVTLKILPLKKGAPIYVLPQCWPDFGSGDSVARLDSVELIEQQQAELNVK